jgi:hypothetical protein
MTDLKARRIAAAVFADTHVRIDPRYPTIGAEQRQVLEATRQALEAEAPRSAAPDPFEAEMAADAAKLERRRT